MNYHLTYRLNWAVSAINLFFLVFLVQSRDIYGSGRVWLIPLPDHNFAGWVRSGLCNFIDRPNPNQLDHKWVGLTGSEYLTKKTIRTIICFCLELYKYIMTKCTHKRPNCDNI